eukprot:Rmarinus@m.29896
MRERDESPEDMMQTKIRRTLSSASSSNSNKKILLVFDMNGVLLYRSKKKDAIDGSPPHLNSNQRYIWFRPHVHEFLDQVLQKCHVGIFASWAGKNLQPVVNQLFSKKGRKKLLFVMDQTWCTTAGRDPDNRHKPLFMKDLHTVFNAHDGFSFRNTLLIDDSVAKGMYNPQGNVLNPPAFCGNMDDDDLSSNGRLRSYLWQLIEESNKLESFSLPNFVLSNPYHLYQ